MCSARHADHDFTFKGKGRSGSVSQAKGQITPFYPETTKNVARSASEANLECK